MNDGFPGTGRIEAFSDGVIAIIITIMVLELKLPEHSIVNGLWAGLLGPLLPKLIPYLLSFVVIAIMWVNHHQLLHGARQATRAVLWSNIHLLLWMSLIPIATVIVGEDPFVPLSVAAYGFVLTANASAFMLLRWCVARQVRDNTGLMRQHNSVMMKNLFAVALYALSVPLAFASVYISMAIFVLIPALFFMPDLLPAARKDGRTE
ncbi:MAG: TMEM175 family protein [Xanthobacteraceae bacterium]